ncbi:Ig-like domain-containing protein [Haloferula sp.]|uniref:Ig-like domain-containing protein n=1 Tax=Haloferula sp. TaxID=2497595 RepID=UPI003C74281A
MKQFPPHRLLSVLVAGLTIGSANGQGIPNVFYSPEEVGTWVAEIDAEGDRDGDGGFGLLPQDGDTVLGINQLLFHKGYMIAPLARNAANRGTYGRRGAMSSFDISDLSDIRRTYFRQDDVTNEIREAHGMVLSSGDLLCINSIEGVQFWDVSDPTDMRLLSDFHIEGMEAGTYGTTGWWVMGQHPIYYLGSTQRGLHIIDGSDPTNPVLIKRIPGGEFGINSVGSVHCIGNLMVLGSAGSSGSSSGPFATVDISDPVNPMLLDAEIGTGNYSVGVYGNYITTHGGGGLKVWDMTDPSDLREIYHDPDLDDALYSCFADDFYHIPNFRTYEKYDFPIPGDRILKSSNLAPISKTHEFTEKVANLVIGTGGGNGDGAKFIPHESEPDTRPPKVNFVYPADLATDQRISTRIGVIVTDTLDFTTVSTSTFLLREAGGEPLAGVFSYSRNYLNFIPDLPLKDDTTYELFIPEGGITDIVGNGIEPFTSRFSTGSEVVVSELPDLVLASPAQGSVVTPDLSLVFSTINFPLGSGGRSLTWSLDGLISGILDDSAPVALTNLSPGPHQIRIELIQDGNGTGITDSVDFTVDPLADNAKPRIILQAPKQTTPNRSVVFDASESFDPDSGPQPLGFTWELLDGTDGAEIAVSDAPTTTVSVGGEGDYNFRLTINDGFSSVIKEFQLSVETAATEFLYVTNTGGFASGDLSIKSYLEARGFSVTGIPAQDLSREIAEGYGLVMISSSIQSSDLDESLAEAQVPIVIWEAYGLDDLGMTSRAEDVHFGVTIVEEAILAAEENPLTAGLAGPAILLLEEPVEVAWGSPGAEAFIGLSDNDGKALIFGYEKGVEMVDFPAPARRVAVPLGDFAFDLFTAQGKVLLNNAIDWARGVENSGFQPLEIDPEMKLDPIVLTSADVSLEARTSGGIGQLEFSWEITDAVGSSSQSDWSPSTFLTTSFQKAGNYSVVLRVRDLEQVKTKLFRLVVHHPIISSQVRSSGGIQFEDPELRRIWNVNPDNLTVSVTDAETQDLVSTINLPSSPRTLSLVGNDEAWVTCRETSEIAVIDTSTFNIVDQISLPRGSSPEGIVCDTAGGFAYVALMGTGSVAKVSIGDREIDSILEVMSWPKGLAIDPEGERLFVTRFISPDDAGKVAEISLDSFSVTNLVDLAISSEPDTISSGRGLPNYLGHPAISPDGLSLLIPSKQDNILRGLVRDGLPLTSENTVRAVVSKVDLASSQEIAGSRWDLNDSDSPNAVAFSSLGNLVFVSVQGNNSIVVLDAYSRSEFTRFEVGSAPDALVLDPEGKVLHVHNFLDRSVSMYDVSELSLLRSDTPVLLGERITVETEALADEVLQGKKVFYNAVDPRMSSDGYISCATCHLDGDGDGRVWDFTDRGEGLRNTTDLRGRSGTGHGRMHWSANFDEVQDFENDIRNHFDGLGFMSQPDFEATSDPLGPTKAGLSPDLDALAAYVESLSTTPISPYRNPDGSLTSDAVYGREIFARLDCASCHAGDDFTDSSEGGNYDVGTLKSTSGMGSGSPLSGIDTPTLRGLWAGQPYYHDGSLENLDQLIESSGSEHGGMKNLSSIEKSQLKAYLLQLEDVDMNPGGPENSRDLSGYFNWRQTFFESTTSEAGDPAAISLQGGVANIFKYFMGTSPDDVSSRPIYQVVAADPLVGAVAPPYVELTVRMRKDFQNLRYDVEVSKDCNEWIKRDAGVVQVDDSPPSYSLVTLRVDSDGDETFFVRIRPLE